MSTLKTKIENSPKKPGIYFFKDKDNNIIYIGKARSLKDRIRSYFLPTSDLKINSIVSETTDIDFILTGSEREATFLENNFIQQYQPKYNLRLKDDKSFPYLKLTLLEKFPGIYLTRRIEKDGARYFGPFSPAHQARKTIHLITKYFNIRTCQEPIPGKRKRPCLEYDLKLCSAPCVGHISETDYTESVENALLSLDGKVGKLLKILKLKMYDAADCKEFEQAAHWRDLIHTLEQIKEKPKMISVKMENKDIFGFARKKENSALYVFLMREGKVIESESFSFQEYEKTSGEEILFNLLLEFYKNRKDIPDKILLPFRPAQRNELKKTLSIWKNKKIEILTPLKGKNKKFVELANRNAEILLQKRSEELTPLKELKKILGLNTIPIRIEGYDISNTGGEESVGSLVVFKNASPQKNEYRKFRIKTVRGPDDVASLQEVIRRRHTKLLEEKTVFPDLILVDGGKGQLNAARKTLSKLGLSHIMIVSLAKKEEIVFILSQKEGLRLDRTSPALKLLQRIRDEAHRFAIAFHRQQREKKSFSSALDNIPGIGKKRKSALLTKYKSIEEIKATPQEELAETVGKKAARELLKKVKSKE